MKENFDLYLSLSVGLSAILLISWLTAKFKIAKLLKAKKELEELKVWKEKTELAIPIWERKSKIVDDNEYLIKENQNKELALKELQKDVKELERRHGELLNYQELDEHGVFNYKYNFQDIQSYSDALVIIKENQKELIKDGSAFKCSSSLKNTPIMNNLSKLALLSFNGNIENIIVNLKYNNYDSCISKIKKLFKKTNDLLSPYNAAISKNYYESKVKEITLGFEFEEEKQRIKQEQDDIKAQMREEQKELEKVEKARDKAIEEEEKIESALDIARQEIQGKAEEERAEFEKKILELEKELETAQQETDRAISNAQITSVGHVYIISNIGSFGEKMYKIGMTRRDDPMDRVRELGGASVPFRFDVHAMVFSDNARKLESDLHNHFNKSRVNKVNKRKEFFNVTLDEVEKACKDLGFDMKITAIADAREFRQSLESDEDIAA